MQRVKRKSDAELVREWGASHGLTTAQLKRLQIRRVTHSEASQLLGFSAPASGILLPYFDRSGKTTAHFRIRFDDAGPFGGKLPKDKRYRQRVNSGVHAYLPPLVPWDKIASDKNAPLLFTEGEAKAAAACAHGLACVGLGGVTMWHKGGVSDLLPELATIDFDGRKVAIIFDSDDTATAAANVRTQEHALAAALVGKGAVIKIVRLPAGENGEKTGLDDFILARGAKALRDLIDSTDPDPDAKELHDVLASFLYVRSGSYVIEPATGQRYTVPQFAGELTANRLILAGKRQMTAGRAFMQQPDRPEVTREVYEPGAERIVRGCFNRWEGWGVEPRPGDVTPFMELVELLVPSDLHRWFLDWLAWPLRHPGAKLSTAVVLVAAQGVGKSTLGDVMRTMYGSQNAVSIDQRVLDSSFNSPLTCRQFIVGEETTTTGRDARQRADVLKNLITAPTVFSNEKFKPQVELENRANFLFLTNHVDAFHLEESDRRFAIIECASSPRETEFYTGVRRWLANAGASHLFHHLQKRELSAFNPYAHAPRSAAKAAMIDASRTALGQWVNQLKEEPDAVVVHDRSPLRRALSLHTAEELLAMFDGAQGRCTVKAMTRELRLAGFVQACEGAALRVNKTDEGRQRFWIVRAGLQLKKKTLAQVAQIIWAERRTQRPVPKLTKLEGGKNAH